MGKINENEVETLFLEDANQDYLDGGHNIVIRRLMIRYLKRRRRLMKKKRPWIR